MTGACLAAVLAGAASAVSTGTVSPPCRDEQAAYERAVAVHAPREERLELRWSLGRCLEQAGRFQDAIEAYQEVAESGERSGRAYADLARVFAEAGLWDQAEEAYGRALRDATLSTAQRATTHVDMARALKRRGEFERAEAHYQQALVDDPGSRAALTGLADVYERTAQLDKATAVLRELSRRVTGPGPEAAKSLNRLGAVLVKRKLYPEAAATFSLALDRSPGDVEATLNLGFTALEQGDPAEAERRFSLVAARPESRAAGAFLRALAALRAGNPVGARAGAEEARAAASSETLREFADRILSKIPLVDKPR